MKPIRTTSGAGIDQGHMQIVLTQKPGERTHRGLAPLFTAIHTSRGEASGDRRRCLDRLLIERMGLLAYFAEASGTNRPETSRRRGLKRHQPPERSEPGRNIGGRVDRQSRLNQRVRQTRVVVGENVFKPEPIVMLVCNEQGHQPVGQQLAHAVGEKVPGRQRAIGVQSEQGKCPGSRR